MPMPLRPRGPYRGLSLTRRPGERTEIDHFGRTFLLEVIEVEPDAVWLWAQLEGDLAVTFALARRGGRPFVLGHDGDLLAILVTEVAGDKVKIRLAGPRSFGIRREDARTGPHEDDPVPEPTGSTAA